MTALVSIGVAGALGPGDTAVLAPLVEDAGFHTLWVNDTPDGDSLAALAAAAGATERLTLATGVIPVDRRPAGDILAAARDLAVDRLVLGIGSGSAPKGARDRVRRAIAELKVGTSASVVVGALGPRMRHVAATESDGALLNWLTPDTARLQAEEIRATGARAILYVRTALDPAAVPTMDAEAARYGSFPNYAANFARLGIAPADTVLRPDAAAARLREYRDVVDEVVLRAVPTGPLLADHVRFVESAAALLAS